MVILTPHVHEDRSGFLAAISNGVQSGVHQAGYDTIYVHPNKLTQGVIDPSLSELLNSKPAGLLLPESVGTTLSTELLAQCRELEISTVVYGGYQGSAEHDRVLSDHDSGSYALTKWLIEKGRKRIVQLGHSGETYWFDDRRRGLERAIHESGLELLPLEKVPVRFVDRSVWTREYFADTVRHLAGYLFPLLLSKNPVDAIVTVSDSLGHQVIAACEYLGKQPHEDVTVVGYDNYWAYSPDRNEVDVPVAATVDKLNFESGLEMVRLIRQRIAGELPPEPQTRVMPPQLVVVQHNGTVTSSGQRQEAAS